MCCQNKIEVTQYNSFTQMLIQAIPYDQAINVTLVQTKSVL